MPVKFVFMENSPEFEINKNPAAIGKVETWERKNFAHTHGGDE